MYVVDGEKEQHLQLSGIGFPLFGELILDCMNRTEDVMTQEHAFKAAELCLIAMRDAVIVSNHNSYTGGNN
ncbi:hypothetical protein [Paenibacillus sp. FSL H7-0331]|uniref:hypothetical protein n=1 Tax=Paenibacillus sp. FSL H7-0331 TaxID=1920421 RepID=UPI00096DB6FB|nr:hypothetical protein BK127_04865 [Paenibacillus sp. FSL H7-0331]